MKQYKTLGALLLTAAMALSVCGCAKEESGGDKAAVQYGDSECLQIEEMLLAHIGGAELDKSMLSDVTEFTLYGSDIISVVCGDKGGTELAYGDALSFDTEQYEPMYEDSLTSTYLSWNDISLHYYDEIRHQKYYEELPTVDLSFAADMKNLAVLKVGYNNEDDFSWLSELKKLEKLEMNDNPISDLSEIAELENLTALALMGNFETLQPLEGMDKLETLFLSIGLNDRESLEVFGGVKRLKYVGGIMDCTELGVFSELSYLDLSESHPFSLDGIEELTKLETLLLETSQIYDIQPISALAELKELYLVSDRWESSIYDISPISGLTNLEVLTFEFATSLDDISALEGLSNLRELKLCDFSLTDLTGIEKLSGLQKLCFYNDKLTDISALSELTELEQLRLSTKAVTDISPLSELNGLKYLNINSLEALSDISPLYGLKKLNYLNAPYQLTEQQLAALAAELPYCNIE